MHDVWSHREAGQVTVAMAGIIAVCMTMIVALAGVSSTFATRAQAQAAADMSALAGSAAAVGYVVGTPCSLARQAATHNGVTLSRCVLDGFDVFVTVSATVPVTIGIASVSATARAGPPER